MTGVPIDHAWKLGDVALVTEYDEPLIALVGRRGTRSRLPMFMYADGGFDVAGPMDIGDGEVLDIAARPLVVLDPEDREQVQAFTYAFLEEYWSERHQTHTDAGQAALRAFATHPQTSATEQAGSPAQPETPKVAPDERADTAAAAVGSDDSTATTQQGETPATPRPAGVGHTWPCPWFAVARGELKTLSSSPPCTCPGGDA